METPIQVPEIKPIPPAREVPQVDPLLKKRALQWQYEQQKRKERKAAAAEKHARFLLRECRSTIADIVKAHSPGEQVKK